MIVEAQVTKDFKQAFDSLPAQKRRIVQEKIDLLANNLRHPSLNTHRLHRPSNVWECYIDNSMRLLYQVKKGILYLWYLGEHAVVDKAHFTYHLRSLEEEEKQLEIEKQRILCYVGMTRAAEELYLVTVEGKESRFVRELEGKVVLNQ